MRLLGWRGISTAAAGATVIVEVLLTLSVLWLFAMLALVLFARFGTHAPQFRSLLITVVVSFAVPLGVALLLRYGSIFQRLEGALRALVGLRNLSDEAESLDRELRACLHRRAPLLSAGTLQLLAMLSGSLEVWFALRLFGHAVDLRIAVILEGITQAARHIAFLIPGGLGVQEASLVVLGHMMGVSGELALAVSLAKRMREIICGVPALLSWQWREARRLRMPMRKAS